MINVLKKLASLKMAIVLFVLLILSLIWGTVLETRFDALYARHVIYLSPWFLGLEGLFFLNILSAILVRLPFKKKQIGFYVIHVGLLLIIIGAAMTSIWGLDAQMVLYPEQKNNMVYSHEPVALFQILQKNALEPVFKEVLLPQTQKKVYLNKPIVKLGLEEFYIEEYLPYATGRVDWQPVNRESEMLMFDLSTTGMNEMISLSDLSYEESYFSLGPLLFYFMPGMEASCLESATNTNAGYVLSVNGECVVLAKLPKEKERYQGYKIDLENIEQKRRVKITTKESKTYFFYPDSTYFSFNEQNQVDVAQRVYLVSLEQLKKENVILFLKDFYIAIGQKTDWSFKKTKYHVPTKLPWMNFTITLNRKEENKKPVMVWEESSFFQKQESSQALNVVVSPYLDQGERFSFWVSDQEVSELISPAGSLVQAKISKKSYELPFYLTLEKFHMTTNPGTKQPASYESFIHVIDAEQKTKAHIYMNHPLKKGKYTFYQSSYVPVENGEFASILTVNCDPGRWVKYIGSLLLVLGCCLYYILKRKKL